MDYISGSIAAPWRTRAGCAPSTRPGISGCSGVWRSAWRFIGYSVNPMRGRPPLPVSLMPWARTKHARRSPWSAPPKLPGCLDASKPCRASRAELPTHTGGLPTSRASTTTCHLLARSGHQRIRPTALNSLKNKAKSIRQGDGLALFAIRISHITSVWRMPQSD